MFVIPTGGRNLLPPGDEHQIPRAMNKALGMTSLMMTCNYHFDARSLKDIPEHNRDSGGLHD